MSGYKLDLSANLYPNSTIASASLAPVNVLAFPSLFLPCLKYLMVGNP